MNRWLFWGAIVFFVGCVVMAFYLQSLRHP
jgi:hypothetical protein